jgi:hypothetical protein
VPVAHARVRLVGHALAMADSEGRFVLAHAGVRHGHTVGEHDPALHGRS